MPTEWNLLLPLPPAPAAREPEQPELPQGDSGSLQNLPPAGLLALVHLQSLSLKPPVQHAHCYCSPTPDYLPQGPSEHPSDQCNPHDRRGHTACVYSSRPGCRRPSKCCIRTRHSWHPRPRSPLPRAGWCSQLPVSHVFAIRILPPAAGASRQHHSGHGNARRRHEEQHLRGIPRASREPGTPKPGLRPARRGGASPPARAGGRRPGLLRGRLRHRRRWHEERPAPPRAPVPTPSPRLQPCTPSERAIEK
mmetsp:Transcript_123143/g.245155  ORF Transcript_123143/g.245155 Transcript_123143/m.245155 type:complete len:250 (+) Transcript_123143:662-1411(+)